MRTEDYFRVAAPEQAVIVRSSTSSRPPPCASPSWPCAASRACLALIAANRDEFHARPAAPAARWAAPAGSPAIYAGRDLQAGGTWMGARATPAATRW